MRTVQIICMKGWFVYLFAGDPSDSLFLFIFFALFFLSTIYVNFSICFFSRSCLKNRTSIPMHILRRINYLLKWIIKRRIVQNGKYTRKCMRIMQWNMLETCTKSQTKILSGSANKICSVHFPHTFLHPNAQELHFTRRNAPTWSRNTSIVALT